MGCYNPMHGYLCQDGRWRMYDKTKQGRPQTVACGQCVGCRLDRSRKWAVRCLHEASLYSANCFITLTYAPEHLPDKGSLNYDDFQKFMKRLRFSDIGADPIISPDGAYSRPIRFYMCGEYGSQGGRPHFHAILFNYDFKDKVFWNTSPSGEKLYRSKKLEELWPFGFSSIGDVTFNSAAYVSRYIMKKVTGSAADDFYSRTDADGRIYKVTPEFNKMSLRPGIGATFFKMFHKDIFPHDYVIVNGKKTSVPRYYDKLYFEFDARTYFISRGGHIDDVVRGSANFEEVQVGRLLNAAKRVDDNTPDRLKVKETITKRRLSMLKRSL